MENKYLNRYIEKTIDKSLRTIGVIVVEGPKFCGKTTTCKQFAKSIYSLDSKTKIKYAMADPRTLLINGERPRLIDEWQQIPDLWNIARSEIDNSDNKFGQFIFTGSTTPIDLNDIYHSGAGRILKIKMYPMSLYESKDSTGQISISELFKDTSSFQILNEKLVTLKDIAFLICRGGWPLSIQQSKEDSLDITSHYCSTLFEFENNKNEKFRNKKKELFEIILKSYARNISTEARKSTIIRDITESCERTLNEVTFDSYHQALKDLFIVEDLDAWNVNLRSKTSIISTPTRHFVDTSIACYALQISPNDLLYDLKTFGLFFEDLVIRDLRIYAETLGGYLRHYRDSNGLECDAVLHLRNGEYALIEIKLGGAELINEGIRSLISLESKILKAGLKAPKFKMILTATGDAYTADGNTYVIPITMLRA